MRRAFGTAIAAAMAVMACAAGAAQPPPPLVRNADFEAEPAQGRGCPPHWWCTMHNRATSFRFEVASEKGKKGRHLKVTRVEHEPWAMATQALPVSALAGKRLRVTAMVNTEGATEGSAGVILMLQGTGGRILGNQKSLLPRGGGWRKATAEVEIAPGTDLVEVGLLFEGGGSVAFDNVVATVEEPPADGGQKK
jgi:hypothetical protein